MKCWPYGEWAYCLNLCKNETGIQYSNSTTHYASYFQNISYSTQYNVHKHTAYNPATPT